MRIAPGATGAGDQRVGTRDANVQYLFGAHEDLILRPVRRAGEAEVVGFLEIQGRARARDAPPRLPEALHDAVEVVREEYGHLGEGLVHFDPQYVSVFCRLGTTLFIITSVPRE